MTRPGQRPADLEFRPATNGDLPAVVALTAELRDRLARWSPVWWPKSEGADVIHPMWLEHLVANIPGAMHVATAEAEVVGCLGVSNQATQWFLDDVAVRDTGLWPAFASALVQYVEQRPALTCLASKDRIRASALQTAGCEHVSSYWVRATTSGGREVRTVDSAVATAPRPPHTFGGKPFDHSLTDAFAFTTRDGSVIGSPPIAAPPVYDPGGSVTVIDLAQGPNLDELLDTALGLAGARSDVLLCVVCGTGDHALAHALGATGFTRTVDVHRLPHPRQHTGGAPDVPV